MKSDCKSYLQGKNQLYQLITLTIMSKTDTISDVMKKNLHPENYRPVVFQDLNNQTTYLTKSTVDTNETIVLDGITYPLVKVHISSSSHPFFTGEERIVDIEGRVDKYKARAAAGEAARKTRIDSAKKKATRRQARVAKAETKKSLEKS
jgi:large subunit ribosomal protein L31